MKIERADGKEQAKIEVGLCRQCRFMQLRRSDRGAVFYLCERSATDSAFPKYPRLPVLECRGYERVSEGK